MSTVASETKCNTLYSFDIFDTLVTRRVAEPVGIFALMQDYLIKNSTINNFVKNNFFRIRRDAENFARINAYKEFNTYEINISDIYNVIKNNYGISEEEKIYLISLEIDFEIKNLVPLDNIKVLKEYISKRERVVLISDMYYGEKELHYILSNIDPIFENIKIYSSADIGLSKANNKLYSYVQTAENIEYQNWHHYGDNKHSDIKNAKIYGIKSNYIPQLPLEKYERILLSEQNNNPLYQAIIGCSRLAKIHRPSQNIDKYDFGVSFAGPILYNYVEWVLEQAISRGFKTLYFVARDGYIPKIIADIIIEARNLPIRTKYNYGSRLAWRVLSETTYDIVIKYLISEYKNKLTPNFIAYRLRIPIGELLRLLKLKPQDKEKKLKKQKNILDKLIYDAQVKKELIALCKDKTDLLKEYFKQEIDFSERDIVFVDIHGSGKTQSCVELLLNEICECSVRFFYIDNSPQYPELKKYGFSIKVHKSQHWIELLCRNKGSQTIGYQKDGNIIKPLFEAIKTNKMDEWGFDEYLCGIKTYTKLILEFSKNNDFYMANLDCYYRYQDIVFNDFDKKNANVLGSVPYLIVGNEKEGLDAAPKISLFRFLLIFIMCKHMDKYTEFPEISAARSGNLCKIFQRFTKDFPTLQKFLFNVYIHKSSKTAYIRIFGIKISIKQLLWSNT